MAIREQVKNINPSVKGPLFRRVMRDQELVYLRKDKGIYGFEVNLEESQDLSGFALIGIQKHSILAFKSDLEEDLRLILFPTLDKLSDNAFDLRPLTVTKYFFDNEDFKGSPLDRGSLGDLVKEYLPETDTPSFSDLEAEAFKVNLMEEVEKSAGNVSYKVETPEPIYEPKMTSGATVVASGDGSSAEKFVESLMIQDFKDVDSLETYVVAVHDLNPFMVFQIKDQCRQRAKTDQHAVMAMIHALGRLYSKLKD